ncbi:MULTISPECIES: glycosyltransferase [unclassified Acinetobacter]|uniref:glycosyltransferase n=1 Tax=unclassified Acinetobacter TaxID=196816 RepID=UPI002934FDE7|nr:MULTISPECIES: glycosyltransferase [unclassified Acinetobacter]WOE30886.1 glycosyltransferase [Acinetobacter sp. SAAs470]WOE39081.1 glycosyltransferase [Acinetobacter sp. SAAs474]
MLNKVMFFLPTLGGGGAERTVIQLANSFAEQGLEIDLAVCSLRADQGKLLPEVSPKISLIDFDCGRVMNAILPLKHYLQQQHYDAVIATQTHSNIICAIAKKLARVKTRLIFREVSTPSKNMPQRGVARLILKGMVNLTYPWADHVVCVSQGVEADFRQYYNYQYANLQTIYNPVLDEQYFAKLAAPVQHCFFNDQHHVIMAVGRLTAAKNFAFLIRAFATLYQQYPDIRLIILGEGELRTELEQLIVELNVVDVVDLAGFDPNPYAYFKYADLFVLSSNWEGLPGVLIQALAAKIKVVSTNCPSGPSEILQQAKFGLLVECNDVVALVAAMQSALFEHDLDYDPTEFEQHCQQFHKTTVLQHYRQMMESQHHVE